MNYVSDVVMRPGSLVPLVLSLSVSQSEASIAAQLTNKRPVLWVVAPLLLSLSPLSSAPTHSKQSQLFKRGQSGSQLGFYERMIQND